MNSIEREKVNATLAIAAAIDRLALAVERLGFDGPGGAPGVLEFIGIELKRMNDNRVIDDDR